jgi:cytochrome c
MKAFVAGLLCSLLSVHSASANQALAVSKNCMACHSVDQKIVGPAFSAVAAKYADDKSALTTLAQKIQKGGGGVWGDMPMPPNSSVTAAEAKKLTTWILSQTPKAP